MAESFLNSKHDCDRVLCKSVESLYNVTAKVNVFTKSSLIYKKKLIIIKKKTTTAT